MNNADNTRHGGYLGFLEWLDEKIYAVVSPAGAGPSDPVVESVGAAVCPICAQPLAQHTIERSLASTVLNCPAEHIHKSADHRPLNEFGIPLDT